jgi:UDP-N-acetylmuramoyl-L-alanyl-D-glutamate--2,6-diaminopimelate ligase
LAEDTTITMEPAAALQTLEIRGLSADSRKVAPGYLFAALPGSRSDGRAFIGEAITRGAVAVLAAPGTSLGAPGRPVALLTDDNPRRRLALIAARYFGRQPATIVAVTGTNGKTSVVEFARQIWAQTGQRAASLGTLGLQPPRSGAPVSLTTPDPVELHRCLAALAGDGIEHLAMEASSHGLDQYRLDGVELRAAAFTNLSRDHLDCGAAVLNADVAEFETLRAVSQARGLRIFSYGTAGGELRLLRHAAAAEGQCLTLQLLGRRHDIALPLAGRFQAANVLAALGLVVATGADPEAALEALPHLAGVAGRLEFVARAPSGGQVYVDYAHTPEALRSALEALRAHTGGRLCVVFGCGGDRDRGKRPQMGEVARGLADRVIVTDDNPRSEDPAAIRREILEAAVGAREIGDRAEAIETAVAALGADDLLVVAGKGHEPGQIVGDRVLPFDDRDVVRAVVARLAEGRP